MFYISLLKQNSTKKYQVQKVSKLDNNNDDNKEYKVKAILDNFVYAKKLNNYLLGFY